MDYFVKALILYERNHWRECMAHSLTNMAKLYGYYGNIVQ